MCIWLYVAVARVPVHIDACMSFKICKMKPVDRMYTSAVWMPQLNALYCIDNSQRIKTLLLKTATTILHATEIAIEYGSERTCAHVTQPQKACIRTKLYIGIHITLCCLSVNCLGNMSHNNVVQTYCIPINYPYLPCRRLIDHLPHIFVRTWPKFTYKLEVNRILYWLFGVWRRKPVFSDTVISYWWKAQSNCLIQWTMNNSKIGIHSHSVIMGQIHMFLPIPK